MRRRLLLGALLLTVGTIAALFVPAAIALSHAEREAQVVELQQEAMDVTARIDPASTRPPLDPATDHTGEDSDDAGDQGHDYARYGADGRRISGVGPIEADAPVLAAIAGRSTTAEIGDERIVAVPLADGGAVRAAEPVSEADARTRAAVLRLAAIAGLILVAGAVASWVLARRLTGPLRELGTSASRLGGGDFTATAPTAGIVEIDEVATALNASAARIGRLVEREQRLTADLSHQLRTPIAGLRIALETEVASPRDDRTEILDEALGAVDRLEATVAALTHLARDVPASDPFAIDDLLAEVGARWSAPLREAGRTLHLPPASGATSRTRRAAIDTIVDVLVDNARTHGRGDVVVGLDLAGPMLCITVADEGRCTLSSEQAFERHTSGSGSSGIGLHLARTLAEAEGARLRLASHVPTTFELQLPTS